MKNSDVFLPTICSNIDNISLAESSEKILNRRAVDVIEAITNIGLKYDEREDTIDMRDMCQAMKDIRGSDAFRPYRSSRPQTSTK